MAHPDPDRLALAALPSEPDDPSVTDHLQHCRLCRDHVIALRRTVDLARAGSPDAITEIPPERVWDAIGSEIEATATTNRPERRRFRWVLAAAAAMVAAIVGASAGWIAGQQRQPDVVAVAQLSGTPSGPEEVSGTVSIRSDGHLDVDLPEAQPTPEGSYLEVWLGDESLTDTVSLGVLRTDGTGQRGLLTLPAGMPNSRFTTIDISVEPLDGDGRHSGNSVLRARMP